MQFEDIDNIEFDMVSNSTVPYRLLMNKMNGDSATSAGQSIAEAAIQLFSTVGCGRFPPKVLADILKKKFSERLNEFWLMHLLSELKGKEDGLA